MASVTFPKLAKSLKTKDGTRYGYIKVEPQAGKPTLLFLHGYPSSSWDWRHQVKQCEDAGYGMIAPDLLGYGDTDKPSDFKAYDQRRVAGHVVDILDHEGLDKVVGIGHDWGCGTLSSLAKSYQNRFSVFIFISVGYIADAGAFADVDGINKMSKEQLGYETFGYWYFHNLPEAASIIEKANPLSLTSLAYPADPKIWIDHVGKTGAMRKWIESNTVGTQASWLNSDEQDVHNKILHGGGYEGPLNWYKQAMAGVTTASEAHLSEDERKIKIPTLFIGTDQDVVCVPAFQEAATRPFVENLTVKHVDASHWAMLEKPQETFGIIDDFVRGNV